MISDHLACLQPNPARPVWRATTRPSWCLLLILSHPQAPHPCFLAINPHESVLYSELSPISLPYCIDTYHNSSNKVFLTILTSIRIISSLARTKGRGVLSFTRWVRKASLVSSGLKDERETGHGADHGPDSFTFMAAAEQLVRFNGKGVPCDRGLRGEGLRDRNWRRGQGPPHAGLAGLFMGFVSLKAVAREGFQVGACHAPSDYGDEGGS